MGRRYTPKTKPYAHQVAAIKKLLKNGWGGALLMEPRTGKTKTAIDYSAILHLHEGVNRILVVCPVSVRKCVGFPTTASGSLRLVT